MRRFILISLFAMMMTFVFGESPHGIGFNKQCDICHTTDNWTKIKPTGYNHDTTSFPLVGQHKTVGCRKCHVDLVFSNAKTACNSCHKDVHQQTVGLDCQRCHNQNSWTVKNIIEIHQKSKFTLTGNHAQLDCNQCHKSASLLRYDPMRSDCIDCHAKDYNATTNPSHKQSRFPTDCTLCHNQNNWLSATFNHNITNFPLKGGHIGVDCIKCHATGYVGTSTQCVSCHLTNYNATTNPNHTLAKLGTSCETCHNTTAWQPSTFNHNTATTFPLTGAHIGVACNACHINNFNPIPTTCVSCHLTNYNATTNPNHKASPSVFTTNCITCHNVTAWIPAPLFNHTSFFPISSGRHSGISCAICHKNASNYTTFTCVTSACHGNAHNQNQGSTGCYSCHPTGRGG